MRTRKPTPAPFVAKANEGREGHVICARVDPRSILKINSIAKARQISKATVIREIVTRGLIQLENV